MNEIIFILIIFVGLIVAYLLWRFENKWREAYRVWAQLHGWSYNFHREPETYDYYSFLNRLQQGSNRYALDVLRGTWEGYPAEAFNFHYETYSTSSNGQSTTTNTHHHYLGVVIIQIERCFPKLLISPQNIFGKIGSALGFGGLQFESVEFSKLFTVRCDDKKFAYDLCHTIMMDYLLANWDIIFELDGNIAVLYKTGGRMTPDEVEKCLVKLCQLRRLMPKYLFRN